MVHTEVSEDCKRKNNQLYYGLLRSGGFKDLVLILNDWNDHDARRDQLNLKQNV